MRCAADNFYFVLVEKIFANSKFRNIADFICVIFRVPLAGDLRGVFFIQNRIKNRLLGQAWRKRGEIGRFD
ncbi:MAG: hypothetical protein AVDCRST_MAG74-3110 [uncultured Pyrinomonadaceae bacterium]|uniref:Uncharacterized protein n=1 Tax=uncultured Pyrinomonadaceae bacterium TaxID=2283094 RepID=A0A6J4PV99_9BACT|nr:MAG: hypothetical protein AVDCRST_MAG74-3110 [uncultured Pyrinomonadaceae bacterium]